MPALWPAAGPWMHGASLSGAASGLWGPAPADTIAELHDPSGTMELALRQETARGLGTVLVCLVTVLRLSQTATFDVLVGPLIGVGIGLGAAALSFAVAVPGLRESEIATTVALVNAAGCFGGAFLQELPISIAPGPGHWKP